MEEPDAPPRPGGEPGKEGWAPVAYGTRSRGASGLAGSEAGAVHSCSCSSSSSDSSSSDMSSHRIFLPLPTLDVQGALRTRAAYSDSAGFSRKRLASPTNEDGQALLPPYRPHFLD